MTKWNKIEHRLFCHITQNWRYRALTKAGKRPTIAVTAIARELAGFIWAIGRAMAPDIANPQTGR